MITIEERITEYTKKLHLPEIRKNYKALATEAENDNLPYQEYILQLLEKENDRRNDNRKLNLIRRAGFFHKKISGRFAG